MKNTKLVIPMAGKGIRFKEYIDIPKPLIPISGKPMIIRTAECLPPTKEQIFVCRGEHLNNWPVETEVKKLFPNAKFVGLDSTTRGFIFTVEAGLDCGEQNPDDSLFVSCCDNGIVYDKDEYEKLRTDETIDCIVWGVKNNPAVCVKPTAWEWIKVDENENITNIGIKKPVSQDPYNDYMLVGNFEFKRIGDYTDAMKMIHKEVNKVSYEFYGGHIVNELIRAGKNVVLFPASLYVSWGYPDQIRLYEEWEKYFTDFQSR